MKVYCPTCRQDTLIGANGCCSWCDTRLEEKPAPRKPRERQTRIPETA